MTDRRLFDDQLERQYGRKKKVDRDVGEHPWGDFDFYGARLYGPIYPTGAGHQKTDTSKAAAEAITPKIALAQKQVFLVLESRGPSTANEIMEALWITDPNSVRPRLTELQGLGRIKDSGQRRKTPAGKTAIVWEVIR